MSARQVVARAELRTLRTLRAAADAHLHAALIAAGHAERTATAHREQLEALAASIRGYEDLLTGCHLSGGVS